MSRERAIVALLAALALARVVAFASAFPFFNNIDEYRHTDRVLKYARGYLPEAALPKIEPQLADWMARFGSPEFIRTLEYARTKAPMPAPREQMSKLVGSFYDMKFARFREFTSVDAQQPPVYPWVAGHWYRLGTWLGLGGANPLYFVRWLDGVALAALVIVSWLFLRRSHPDDLPIRLGVPLWIAFYPNDFLYAISDDILMPLLGGLAFALTLCATATTPTRTRLAAIAGLVCALALLDKWTAMSFLPVAAMLAVGGLLRARRARSIPAEMRAWLAFGAACAVPMAWWIARNLAISGDAMGMGLKNAYIGVATVPMSRWITHPLLGPQAWFDFLPNIIRTFWRGELSWYAEPLRSAWLDAVYIGSTGVALVLTAVAVHRAVRGSFVRRVEGAALVSLGAALATLAAMSIFYEVDPRNWSGGRYLSSARYAAWALLPFAICYVRGIEMATRRLPERWRHAAFWSLLGALLAISTIGEIVLSVPVFQSPWNWYHLPT